MSGPVTVDVGSVAGGSGVRSAVLAPETGVGLGVNETVGVYYGENIEVIFIDGSFNVGSIGVVAEEGVDGEFSDHLPKYHQFMFIVTGCGV